jgi:hypothetical protein
MIGTYPYLTELTLADRALLDPLFHELREGLSELCFAGLYCFRISHGYRIGRLDDGTIILSGDDKGAPFFLCPFALPHSDLLGKLFERFTSMKLVTESQAERLREAGFVVTEDRDNFDYLYDREHLASLAGRAYQKKRNLVHAFEKAYPWTALPLSSERIPDAVEILEAWRQNTVDLADYAPAHDAMMHTDEFGLVGKIYYIGSQPAGYTLGESLASGTMFAIHYEKTIPHTKGLYQLINMDFARSLPASYKLINREQDVGDPGLRQAKLTYRPTGFVKKYRARSR